MNYQTHEMPLDYTDAARLIKPRSGPPTQKSENRMFAPTVVIGMREKAGNTKATLRYSHREIQEKLKLPPIPDYILNEAPMPPRSRHWNEQRVSFDPRRKRTHATGVSYFFPVPTANTLSTEPVDRDNATKATHDDQQDQKEDELDGDYYQKATEIDHNPDTVYSQRVVQKMSSSPDIVGDERNLNGGYNHEHQEPSSKVDQSETDADIDPETESDRECESIHRRSHHRSHHRAHHRPRVEDLRRRGGVRAAWNECMAEKKSSTILWCGIGLLWLAIVISFVV